MSFRGKPRGGRGGGSTPRSGPPPSKKLRHDDDDDGEAPMGTFEERLAGMLDEEDDLVYGQDTPTEMEEVIESHEERFVRWRRPPPPPLNTEKDTLVFQQIDIDHYIGKPYPGMPGAKTGSVPIMRMFGVNKAVS